MVNHKKVTHTVTHLKQLNANNCKHELEQKSDEHDTVDCLDRHNDTLYNVLQHTTRQFRDVARTLGPPSKSSLCVPAPSS